MGKDFLGQMVGHLKPRIRGMDLTLLRGHEVGVLAEVDPDAFVGQVGQQPHAFGDLRSGVQSDGHTAQVMGVMGSAWLIASMALTVVAAILLGIAVLGTQDDVVTHLDKPERTPASVESLIARLPRLSMITGLFALAWLIVVVLMIVRPGSTTGA